MLTEKTPPPHPPLSSAERQRYARQLILPGWGPEAQQRAAATRVLVVGVGGLGSPVALYLAAAGVGTLGLCDNDTVALHNLHRQVLHTTGNVGQPKVASAAHALAALSPHPQLVLHGEGLSVANAAALLAAYDLVVDCADNFPTRYLLNDAAVLARKPVVWGSIHQWEGQVSVFAPHLGGPCFRCLFPDIPAPGEVPNCAEAGVLGALCGVVGSLQAVEVLKLIAGLPPTDSLLGRLWQMDARTGTTRTLRLKRDPACPVCGSAPTITELRAEHYEFACATDGSLPDATMPQPAATPMEISVQEAHRLLSSPQPPVLLDVREPDEVEICAIAGSVHIPMREVPQRLAQLPKDRAIVVQCHHGSRSLHVTKYLRQMGFEQTMNLRGGIEQWSREIDPSVPRY